MRSWTDMARSDLKEAFWRHIGVGRSFHDRARGDVFLRMHPTAEFIRPEVKRNWQTRVRLDMKPKSQF